MVTQRAKIKSTVGRLSSWFNQSWRYGWSAALFIFFFVLLLLAQSVNLPDWISHLLLVLTAMLGVHLLERMFLWTDVKRTMRTSSQQALRESFTIMQTAESVGLEKMYPSREAAKEDICRAIENADERVYLLGVALSEQTRLIDLLKILERRLQGNHDLDVKLLLLDPLRSPALFRTMLESGRDAVERLLKTDRSTQPVDDPYYSQRLYSDFRASYDVISNSDRFLPRTRFYAHAPSCWLVVVDHAVFFQPYSFGGPPVSLELHRCIGDSLPIFKFTAKSAFSTYDVLVEHFDKLWRTTDTDMFHMGIRKAARHRIIRALFERRRPWLQFVWEALYGGVPTTDQRGSTRQSCSSDDLPVFELRQIGEDGKPTSSQASVKNYSRSGLLLEMADAGFGVPREGQTVRLALVESEEWRATEYIRNRLVGDGEFKVKRIVRDGDDILVAVQKTSPETLAA